MAIVGFKNLCPPALFYLVISFFALLLIAFQNYGNENIYCLGYYSCPITSIYLLFILKIIYIIFWTWVLNIICRAGYPTVSWVLVIIPIILFFILLGLMIIHSPMV